MKILKSYLDISARQKTEYIFSSGTTYVLYFVDGFEDPYVFLGRDCYSVIGSGSSPRRALQSYRKALKEEKVKNVVKTLKGIAK